MIHIVLYMQNGYFHRMLSFYSNIRHIFYIRTGTDLRNRWFRFCNLATEPQKRLWENKIGITIYLVCRRNIPPAQKRPDVALCTSDVVLEDGRVVWDSPLWSSQGHFRLRNLMHGLPRPSTVSSVEGLGRLAHTAFHQPGLAKVNVSRLQSHKVK